MHKLYYGEEIPYKITSSIFLAGCSLRAGQEKLENWRDTALQILQDKGYSGLVFIPENRNGKLISDLDYGETIEWEEQGLNIADQIIFWVDRDIDNGVYGLTTNAEWSAWNKSGKAILGSPEDAEKNKYLEYYADKYNVPIYQSLTETIEAALEIIGEGADRSLGERYIPLNIFRLPTFQNWYSSLMKAGNRLESCETLLSIPTPKNPSAAIWIIKPNVYIAVEDRFKSNEIVLGRPDISSVCMYKRTEDDIEIVLVKEFRSAVANKNGFVYELPSGGFLVEQANSHQENALKEVREETGFVLDEKKLKFEGKRQLASTMMAHKSFLFSYELEDKDLEWFKAQKDIAKGVKKEDEKCFVEVVKLSDIKEKELVDWSMFGQIMKVFN